MEGALVILVAMVVVGLLLYITDVKYFRHHHGVESPESKESTHTPPVSPTDEEICCGQHLVCEKTSLAIVSDEIIYYDDEELDRFVGRGAESYSEDETEEFRDVLMTLLPEDVAGWARSITLRQIELPPGVKDELLLLIQEQRNN